MYPHRVGSCGELLCGIIRDLLRYREVASVEDRNNQKRKSRDLQFEDENDGEVNTKSQVAPKGDPFVALYELNHK